MEEQLIALETAKLAKEKGYRNENLAWHGIDKDGVYFSMNKEFAFGEEGYNIPTQSLLQKYLRDIHNIHIEIFHWTEQPVEDTIWPHSFQPFVDGDALDAFIYDNYEKALEAGLVTALNLI